jgi:hypothetical protein
LLVEQSHSQQALVAFQQQRKMLVLVARSLFHPVLVGRPRQGPQALVEELVLH